jgi:hypothetical protein
MRSARTFGIKCSALQRSYETRNSGRILTEGSLIGHSLVRQRMMVDGWVDAWVGGWRDGGMGTQVS